MIFQYKQKKLRLSINIQTIIVKRYTHVPGKITENVVKKTMPSGVPKKNNHNHNHNHNHHWKKPTLKKSQKTKPQTNSKKKENQDFQKEQNKNFEKTISIKPIKKPILKEKTVNDIFTENQKKNNNDNNSFEKLKNNTIESILGSIKNKAKIELPPDATSIFNEAKNRGLGELEKTNIKTTYITEQNTVAYIENGPFKLSQKGQAYCKLINEQKKKIAIKADEKTKEDNNEYFIGQITERPDILSGKHKHFIICYNKTYNSYEIIGYITSKQSGIYLTDEQFTTYQKNKNPVIETNVDSTNEVKTQKFALLKNPELISKDKIKLAKWGTDYIKEKNIYPILNEQQKNQNSVDTLYFLENEYTLKNLIDAITLHDQNLLEKKKHPMTDDQIKQQLKGIEKQKKLQEEKKLKKNISDNEYTEDE